MKIFDEIARAFFNAQAQKKTKKDPFFKIKQRPGIRTPIRAKSKVYKKASDKDVGRLVKRAYAISKQLDEVKPLYGELDEITHALLNVQALKKNGALEKYGVAIVDQYAEKNTAFRTVGIQRFKLNWLRK